MLKQSQRESVSEEVGMGGWGLLGTSEMCTNGFDCEFISNGGCFFAHTDLEMGLSDIPSGEEEG